MDVEWMSTLPNTTTFTSPQPLPTTSYLLPTQCNPKVAAGVVEGDLVEGIDVEGDVIVVH